MADNVNHETYGEAPATRANTEPPRDVLSKGHTALPPGLAAAIALVVAGLAAVGVTGDALTKAVRNEPGALGAAVILALAASVLLAVTTVFVRPSSTRNVNIKARLKLWSRDFWKTGNSWVTIGLMALLAGVAWAILLGASSVADREQPLVTLSFTSERTGNRMLTIHVSASSLRTSEQILVQVIGLSKFTQANKSVVQICETSWTYNSMLILLAFLGICIAILCIGFCPKSFSVIK
jgi:hypothetical protein